MNEENLKKLYEAASKKLDVGSFDTFSFKMQDEGNRKKLYDNLSPDLDFGSFDLFEEKLGLKKKSTQPEVPADSGADEAQPSQDQMPVDDMESRVQAKREEETVGERIFGERFMTVWNNVGNTFENIGNALEMTVHQIGEASSAVTDFVTGEEGDNRLQESRHARMNKIAGFVDENNKQIQANTIVRSYNPELSFEENVQVANQGIVDTFEKDGWVAGLGEAGIKALESSPYVITSVATGGAGGAALTGTTFFATGYGTSLAESLAADGNIDAVDQSRALLKGIVEGGASIAFGGISKAGKDFFSGVGREEAKKVLGNNMKNQLMQMLGNTGKTAVGEGLEESVQEIANYTIDTFYDGKDFNPEKALRIAMDSFILGTTSGTAVGGGMNTYNYIQAKTIQDQTLSDVENEMEQQSTKDNPIKMEMLREQKKQFFEDMDLKDVSDEDGKKLQDLYYDIKDLEHAANGTQSENLRSKMTDEMNNKIEELNATLAKYDSDQGSTEGEGLGELDVSTESEDAGSSEEAGLGAGASDSETPRANPESVKKFAEESTLSLEYIDNQSLKGKRVNAADIIGEDVGEISAIRAQQIVKKQGKKYEALINCMKK